MLSEFDSLEIEDVIKIMEQIGARVIRTHGHYPVEYGFDYNALKKHVGNLTRFNQVVLKEKGLISGYITRYENGSYEIKHTSWSNRRKPGPMSSPLLTLRKYRPKHEAGIGDKKKYIREATKLEIEDGYYITSYESGSIIYPHVSMLKKYRNNPKYIVDKIVDCIRLLEKKFGLAYTSINLRWRVGGEFSSKLKKLDGKLYNEYYAPLTETLKEKFLPIGTQDWRYCFVSKHFIQELGLEELIKDDVKIFFRENDLIFVEWIDRAYGVYEEVPISNYKDQYFDLNRIRNV